MKPFSSISFFLKTHVIVSFNTQKKQINSEEAFLQKKQYVNQKKQNSEVLLKIGSCASQVHFRLSYLIQ